MNKITPLLRFLILSVLTSYSINQAYAGCLQNIKYCSPPKSLPELTTEVNRDIKGATDLGQQAGKGLQHWENQISNPNTWTIQTNKGDVQARVMAKYEVVLWGKKIDDKDYAEFAGATVASVLTAEPGPLYAWVQEFAEEQYTAIIEAANNMREDLASRFTVENLVQIISQIIQHGGTSNINLNNLKIEAGIVSYNHWKEMSANLPDCWDGCKWKLQKTKLAAPNTHQIYIGLDMGGIWRALHGQFAQSPYRNPRYLGEILPVDLPYEQPGIISTNAEGQQNIEFQRWQFENQIELDKYKATLEFRERQLEAERQMERERLQQAQRNYDRARQDYLDSKKRMEETYRNGINDIKNSGKEAIEDINTSTTQGVNDMNDLFNQSMKKRDEISNPHRDEERQEGRMQSIQNAFGNQ
jgi:hypothetical protein